MEYADQFLHGTTVPLPFKHITLLKTESGSVELYLDYTHISNVYVDDIDYPSLVTWTDSVAEGSIELIMGGKHAYGTFDTKQPEAPHYAMSLQLRPISYIISMATSDECGAYKVSEVGDTNLKWDETSAQWKAAKWVPNQLNFTYGIKGTLIMGEPMWDIEVHFGDLVNGNHWDPMKQEFSALLNHDFKFDFSLHRSMRTPIEDRNSPDQIDYIYPYKMSFKFNEVANHFDGAILTNDAGAQGIVYGIQGEVNYPNIVGSYHVRMLDHTTATIGMAGGKLYVNGECVGSSRQEGNTVIWQLPESQLSHTNIPREGYAVFSQHGDRILHGTGISTGERVLNSPSEDQEPQHDSNLNLNFLLGMSQYVFVNGSFQDDVQMKSTGDLMMILQYHMDPQLREDYVSVHPPDIDATVRGIAEVIGLKGTNPQTFYRLLSIPYITSALAGSTDPFAKKLNSKRASAWLKSKVGRSDVYQAQSPKLYQHHYLLKLPEMGDYIEDQTNHAAEYVDKIKTYEQQWIHDMSSQLENKTLINKTRAIISNLTDKAVTGHFWAYLFFCYITQPSAMMMLQAISMSPSYEGSTYARRVQEHCAVLTALDQESVFVQQYIKIMQSFQITNMIPTLLDYSGDVNQYNYAVNAVLNDFITRHAESSDPDIIKYVSDIKASMAAGTISSIMDAVGGIAGSVSGIYGWEVIADRLETVSKLRGFSIGVTKIVGGAMSAIAFVGFIMGAKGWNGLNILQQTQLVASATALCSEIFFSIIKRGVALNAIWSEAGIKWFRVDLMLKENVLIEASEKSATGFKRWLLGAEEEAPALGVGAFEAAAESESFSVTKAIFGKNIKEFWATRVTAVLSILNILLISYVFATATLNEIEIAENSMFMMAACIDLVASIGMWALGEGAVGTLATVFGAMGPVSIALALIGVILMILDITKHHEGPVEKFARNQASDAGFYMPYEYDIDYFQVYKIKGESQRLRIAMCIPGEWLCLYIGQDGALFMSNFDYSGRSGFFLKTDSDGYVTISALIDDASPPVAYQLVMNPDGRISASQTSNNSYHLWVAEMLDDPTLDNGNLQSALFSLYSVGYLKERGVKNYFSADNHIHGNPNAYGWQITMENLAPGKLSMGDLLLYTFHYDQAMHPYMLETGSQPLTWSLNATIPNFMKFNTSTGTLSQVTGMPPLVTNTIPYQITVTNEHGSSYANFNFNVTEKQFLFY